MSTSETLDRLMPGNLWLWQSEAGYRYSVDAVLLAYFAGSGTSSAIADLGTGNGVLPLLLARMTAADSLCGFERQPEMVLRARRNVDLNKLGNRISIIEGDIREIRSLHQPGSMDLVVANPPYRAVGSGRMAPHDERAAARHELAGTIEDFLKAAEWLLERGGRFAVIYPAERLYRLMAAMAAVGIEPKRLRMIHPRANIGARLALFEGRKGGRPGMKVEKPLVMYHEEGHRNYTAEVNAIYRMSGPSG